jgi:hypothetical protein
MAVPAGVNEGTPHEPAPPEASPHQTEEAGPPPAGPETALTAGDAGEEAPADLTAAEDRPGIGKPPAAGDQAAEPGIFLPPPLIEGSAEAELAGAELPEGADELQDVPGQTRPGRDVSPLAIAGIIIGVIALVGVAAGVLAVLTHGFKPKTVVTYQPAAVYKLQPGQCVNLGANGLADTVVSCGTPHDAEVFASFQLTGSWPGSAEVKQAASNGCASRFSSYLNPQLATAALDQQFVYPNEQAWNAGERTVVCEVSSSDGKLTGSVRNPAPAT